MSRSIESLDETAYEALLMPIWDFLARTDDPAPSDVIFVFGSRDLGVARRAAELYTAGLASRVLVTGLLGPMTERVFDKPEALVFKAELTRLGVPDRAITTDVRAGNTLENVRFGMTALRAAGQTPRSTLLVAKAFVMRRCLATFARQYPAVTVRGCPPAGSLAAQRDRPRAASVRTSPPRRAVNGAAAAEGPAPHGQRRGEWLIEASAKGGNAWQHNPSHRRSRSSGAGRGWSEFC